ncbi:hypothetical protein [Gordonia malaquae]|uniref:hypothetical protein n=1 Tax=Gordonia malaquae TaxID=410332 RepID=UPI0030FE3D54
MTMAADIAVSNSETLRVLDEFFHDIGLCRPNEAAGFAASTAALAARLLFAKGGAARSMGASAATVGVASLIPDCGHPKVVAVRPAGEGGTAYAIPAEWGLDRLMANVEPLAARLRAQRVSIRHNEKDRSAGLAWIVVQVTDPLDRVIGGRVPPPAPPDLTSILLGMTEEGRPALIPLKDRNGIAYAAESGGGKTFTINACIAGWAQHESVQLAIIDGKAGADYVAWEPRAQVVLPTTDRTAVVEALRPYREELNRRTELYRRKLEAWRDAGAVKGQEPATSFWHEMPTPDLPLIVIVVDEIQVFTSGAKSREEKAIQEELVKLLGDLMNRGRSTGIVTIVATQKSTADAIPTEVRDKASLRLVGRLSTSDAVVAGLGRAVDDGEPDPRKLPQRPGMVIMAPEGGGLLRARSWLVDPGDLVRLGIAVTDLRRPLPVIETSEGTADDAED